MLEELIIDNGRVRGVRVLGEAIHVGNVTIAGGRGRRPSARSWAATSS
ncbi:MAG: hypothetical protein U0694_01265 [Anaerolineae bacterium]